MSDARKDDNKEANRQRVPGGPGEEGVQRRASVLGPDEVHQQSEEVIGNLVLGTRCLEWTQL